jgi:hypothetical protein
MLNSKNKIITVTIACAVIMMWSVPIYVAIAKRVQRNI